YNFKTIFTIPNKLNQIIKSGKDKIENKDMMGVVYKIDCKNCDSCYVGQTKRRLDTRIKEHKADINKDPDFHSVVSKHRLDCNHEFDWINTQVLHRKEHIKKREIAEMYFIKRHDKTINTQNDTENLPSVYDNILR
ncbi:hypothetical protein X777_01880, partial [Ooceraea biroi]